MSLFFAIWLTDSSRHENVLIVISVKSRKTEFKREQICFASQEGDIFCKSGGDIFQCKNILINIINKTIQ